MNKQKIHGQVFTPEHTVELMLDLAGYLESDKDLLQQKVLEPSSGEGVFLQGIVKRVLSHAQKHGISEDMVLAYLDNNVYAVELDTELYQKSIKSLNSLLEENGYSPLSWGNIHNDNALTVSLPSDFDLVVGNPPYVRVHNMDESTRKLVKTFSFAGGSTDLYIAFMEKGLSILSKKGKMVFITPNSFMKNTSQGKLRKHLVSQGRIDTLINYRSSKVFDNADTYAAISVLTNKSDRETFSYKTWDGDKEYTAELSYADLVPQDREWNFGHDGKNFEAQKSKTRSIADMATVGYGIATLRDKLYIDLKVEEQENGLTLFHGQEIESDVLLPIVKISTYKGEKDIQGRIIFPYKIVEGKTRVLPEEVFSSSYPRAYAYLQSHRESLDKRSMDANATWYQFGRSQGLAHVEQEKMILPPVIRAGQVPAVYDVPAHTLVYSGFYLTPKEGYTAQDVKDALQSEGIADYLKSSGQDMSGGYISYKAKTIRDFRF